MSGNMSFINNNSSSVMTVPASVTNDNANASRSGNTGNSTQLQNSSLLRGGRSSLSFSESGSPTSFQNDGQEKVSEYYQDKDVWGTRIILSSLEEITFFDGSYPKLSPEIKHNIQRFLLAMNGWTSNANPFIENQKNTNGSIVVADNNTLVEDSSGSKLRGKALEIPREVLETLNSLPAETKIVLRSLISTYVRNIGAKIVEVWKPILEADGVTIPQLKSTIPKSKLPSRVAAPKKMGSESQGSSVSLEGYELEGCLELILDKMRSSHKESPELDLKIRDLMKARDEQLFKYERDIKALNQINLAMLQEKVVMEAPEFVNCYMNILELENKVIEEQLRLVQMKLEAEKKSEEEQKTREELYNKVKVLYEQMEAEVEEMEEKVVKYKSLGQEYEKIQDQYKSVEEEINTKEWVKEQLLNGPKNESLFNNSL